MCVCVCVCVCVCADLCDSGDRHGRRIGAPLSAGRSVGSVGRVGLVGRLIDRSVGLFGRVVRRSLTDRPLQKPSSSSSSSSAAAAAAVAAVAAVAMAVANDVGRHDHHGGPH